MSDHNSNSDRPSEPPRLVEDRVAAGQDPEQRASESDQRFRTLFEHSPLPMYLYDPRTLRILAVNQASVDTYGFTREEFAEMTLYDLRPGEEFLKLEAALLRAEVGRIDEEVFIHRCRDGALHPAEVSTHPIPVEGRTAQLVIARDIRERLTAAGRLQVAHDLNRALVRNAPVAIVTSDRSMRVTSWNPAAERLFGWSETEVLGHPPPFFPEDEVDEVFASGSRQPITNVPLESWEARRVHRDGRLLHVLVSTALLRDDEGKPNGRVSFILDLSERKQLEEQFRQSQKLEAIGQLAGGVAHDFNNLLAVILSNLRLTATDVAPGSETHECVVDALAAAERAAVLTRQLLNFSRRNTTQSEPLELDEVVRDAERMLRRLIRSDIRLTTRLGAGGAHVRADVGHLEQVLVNLVVNARDAMPRGGELTVVTSVREVAGQNGHGGAGGDGHGSAAGNGHGTVFGKAGRFVVLEVSDTGEGMAESTRQHIFEPFFTTKPVGQGTGLGLATVYGFVQQWGGSIHVQSAPGRGTTFSIQLPLQAVPTDADSEEAATDAAPGGTETILVVDDEQMVLTALRRQLERHGYRVLTAGDGLSALRLLEEHREEIALVVTDLVMPELGGRELAEQLRARAPSLRILIMSAYDRDGVESGTGKLGGIDLHKPFQPAELLRKIREALDSPRPKARRRATGSPPAPGTLPRNPPDPPAAAGSGPALRPREKRAPLRPADGT